MDPKLVLRPKGVKPAEGKRAELIEEGKALFENVKLSTNGMACQSCHTDNANFSASFAKPYPHVVAMVKEAGVKKVQLDEMVQFCMLRPMQAKPLAWDSRELAALTAYSAELQTAFRRRPPKASAGSANPCNPCAPKPANPCAPRR
ncbi:MAG: hypothetical protein HYS06_08655 [Methylocystis sp.]|nr:hypothetical protein [Methylocystis sp.]